MAARTNRWACLGYPWPCTVQHRRAGAAPRRSPRTRERPEGLPRARTRRAAPAGSGPPRPLLRPGHDRICKPAEPRFACVSPMLPFTSPTERLRQTQIQQGGCTVRTTEPKCLLQKPPHSVGENERYEGCRMHSDPRINGQAHSERNEIGKQKDHPKHLAVVTAQDKPQP